MNEVYDKVYVKHPFLKTEIQRGEVQIDYQHKSRSTFLTELKSDI